MRWLQIVRLRLRALLRGSAVDRDLEDEMRAHLQSLVDESIAGGLSPRDAHDTAVREFGRLERLKEECREARGVTSLTSVAQDVSYGLRLLRRSPSFTTAAVLMLALGIGANTAVFSLVHTVVFRQLPVERPHELVSIYTVGTEGRGGTPPYPFFVRVRDESSAFSGIAATAADELRLKVDGMMEQVYGQLASGSYFEMLRLKPAAGRLLTRDDETLDPPVAVIGYGYWQRRFGGDGSAIGKTITVGDRAFIIVGVTPREFWGLDSGRQIEVTLPITQAGPLLTNLDTWSWYGIVARVRPEIGEMQATAQVDTIFQSFMNGGMQTEEMRAKHFARIELASAARGSNGLRNRFSRPLYVLTFVAAIVLLIACVNLGNLLLVRGAARTREFAIRLATGASAGRLVRQMLIETALLFLLGASAGILVATLVIKGLTGVFAIGRNPIVLDVHYDWTLAAFAFGVSMIASLLTGVWPALRTSRLDAHTAMKDGGQRASSRAMTLSARTLVASQVALSLVLVIGAVMFVRTMMNLRAVDLGFRAERVLTMSLDPLLTTSESAPARARFWRQALDRVRSLPLVRSASLSVLTPLSGRDTGRAITVAGYQPRSRADAIVRLNHVSEDYFRTFGIDLASGRAFTANDDSGATKVAVINEATEQAYFAGRSALGETVRLGESGRYEIVGVVRNHKHRNLREQPARFVFVPIWQPVDGLSRITLSVSSAVAPAALAATVAQEVRAIYANTLVSDVIGIEEQIDATLVSERLLSTLASSLAALAVGVAAIGLYGVISYSVTRRRNEFGVRLALGARPSSIAAGILGEVALQLSVGIAIGIPLALAVVGAAESLLFGTTTTDPGNYALSVLALVAVATLAGLLPARRAGRLDPTTALRAE